MTQPTVDVAYLGPLARPSDLLAPVGRSLCSLAYARSRRTRAPRSRASATTHWHASCDAYGARDGPPSPHGLPYGTRPRGMLARRAAVGMRFPPSVFPLWKPPFLIPPFLRTTPKGENRRGTTHGGSYGKRRESGLLGRPLSWRRFPRRPSGARRHSAAWPPLAPRPRRGRARWSGRRRLRPFRSSHASGGGRGQVFGIDNWPARGSGGQEGFDLGRDDRLAAGGRVGIPIKI